MNTLSVALSQEAEKGILANIERGLFEYVIEKRAAHLDYLIGFSINEFAAAKGVSVKEAKSFLTKKGISIEPIGYKTKRFPFRELKQVCDEVTVRRLSLIQRQRQSKAA